MTKRNRSAHVILIGAFFLGSLTGCESRRVEPVELYPEDMCSFCRMAISDYRCAAEMITSSGETAKFDDINCMRRYHAANPTLEVAATFVKNYEDRSWLSYERAVIITTDLMTPMGSGLIAFVDSARARAFLASVPAR